MLRVSGESLQLINHYMYFISLNLNETKAPSKGKCVHKMFHLSQMDDQDFISIKVNMSEEGENVTGDFNL